MSDTSPSGALEQPRKRRLKRSIIAFLILTNLLVFGVIYVIKSLTDQFLESVSQNEQVVSELTPADSEDPLTFLVIGSDSRQTLPDDFGDFGNFGGQRADVIMLVRIQDGKASILSLPRDLKVEVDGHGTQKINAAYAFGGAALMVNTVAEFTGISINHYVEMDFFGFASIVDELGGVDINFSHPARDLKSDLEVGAGTQTLDGKMALAYARSRRYQELHDGAWGSVEGSDLGRIGRQQSLVFAMLSAAKRPSIMLDAPGLISAVGEHLTIDAIMDESRLVDLVVELRNLEASNIIAVTLPTTASRDKGVFYLVADQPAADAVLAAFAGGQQIATPTGPLVVTVLNGNGEPGSATRWGEHLVAQGFEISELADATSFDFSVTIVTARPTDMARAQSIVDALGFGVLEAGSVPEGLDAIVTVGADAAGAVVGSEG